jgi:hypothetical protein
MAETAETTQCPHCGGATQGLVCSFCGSLLSPVRDVDTEKRALEDFHGLLATANPENQAKLLKHGFLPTQPQVLIDAGFRCLLLIRSDSTFGDFGHSAKGRLKVIASKLHMLTESEDARRALKEFEAALHEYETGDATNNRQALIFLVVTFVLIIALVWVIARLFSK